MFLASRLASLGVVLVIRFLLLASFVVTIAIGTVLRFAEDWIPVPALLVAAADTSVSLLIATALFAMIFTILPDVRLHWRDMWFGAVLTAVLFVTGQSVISLYLTRTATTSTYGAAGSLVMVLLWVYYPSLIFFVGTALTRAAIRAGGDRIVPKPTAACAGSGARRRRPGRVRKHLNLALRATTCPGGYGGKGAWYFAIIPKAVRVCAEEPARGRPATTSASPLVRRCA